MRFRLLSSLVFAATFVGLASPIPSVATDAPDPVSPPAAEDGPSAADATAIHRWRDAKGTWHFSNVPERIPSHATVVPFPADERPVVRRSRTRAIRRMAPEARAPIPRQQLLADGGGCGAADTGGLIDAVATEVAGRRRLEQLTLLVGGTPVAFSRDAVVTQIIPAAAADEDVVSAEPGAVAYPASVSCPARPPLPRYPVVANHHAGDSSLCDDYRRAFAQVGVAGSRNQQVGRSFHEIAEEFAVVRAANLGRTEPHPEAAVVRRPGAAPLPLPAWTIDAHVGQTDELGRETDDLVSDLTVALEEIDHAARAHGCW
jgi:hypothetical protein